MALVQPALEDLAPQVAGHVLPVLEDAAVQIDDVQRAIGRGIDIDRPKPLVGGGEEFLLLVGVVPAENSVLLRHD